MPLLAKEHHEGLSPLAPNNPYSIFNMVPPKMQRALEALDKRLLLNSERNLRRNCNITPEICRLRINLWDSYNKAMDMGQSKIPMYEIIKGACSQALFEEVVLTNPNTLAYVCVPPADYQLTLRDLLDFGWDRLRETLEQDIFKERVVRVGQNADGTPEYKTFKEVNVPLVAEMRAIVQMLDLRVKGAILQKVQVQSHNITQTIEGTSNFNDATLEQLEAMERRVKKLSKSFDDVEEQGVLDAAQTIEAEEDTSATPADGQSEARCPSPEITPEKA